MSHRNKIALHQQKPINISAHSVANMKISLQHPSNFIAGSHYLQQGTLHYITL